MESDERVSVVFDQCEQDLSTNCLRLKHYRGHRRHLLRFIEVTIRMKSNTNCKSFSGSFWSRCTKGVKHAESRPIYPGYVEASLSGRGKLVTIRVAQLFHIFFLKAFTLIHHLGPNADKEFDIIHDLLREIFRRPMMPRPELSLQK